MLDEGTGGFDVSDARLIDPSKFELKAWELWPSSITESASALRKMGSASGTRSARSTHRGPA